MLSLGFVVSAKVMHIQIIYLLPACKILVMHKFGNLDCLKLSRILNNSDYFIFSDFTTVLFLGRLDSLKENTKYCINTSFGVKHQNPT